LDEVTEDVRTARQIGATELFFDLWTEHPEVDTVDDWLIRMEQLWMVATPA
jgi:hypothetical protein